MTLERAIALLTFLAAGVVFREAYAYANGLLYFAGGLFVFSGGVLLCLPRAP